MDEVNGLRTAGKTPLTDAVAQAADILEFRHKPGVVVVLTDGKRLADDPPAPWASRSASRPRN
jgi:Ca-activated chloride channel family protein